MAYQALPYTCISCCAPKQGCQMVGFRVARWFVFKPKNPNLGKFWNGNLFKYFTAVWYNLWSFGIVYDRLVSVVVIWYTFFRFGKFGPRKIWQPCPRIFFLRLVWRTAVRQRNALFKQSGIYVHMCRPVVRVTGIPKFSDGILRDRKLSKDGFIKFSRHSSALLLCSPIKTSLTQWRYFDAMGVG
jgi:hypothetical protein